MTYAATPLRLDRHRDALSRLWAENMTDARIAAAIPDRMRWLYYEAPDGPATTVLATVAETGEVVGCGSFIQRPTWVDGRRLRGGVLCDFAVTRAHRIAGAALTVQRALVDAARAAGVELLYGYPNAKSLAVFKRIGYRVVGETTTWVKPLRAGYKLRERGLGWVAPVAAAPADLALRALDAARAVRAPLRARGEDLALPDGRVDALFHRAHARLGVVGERSSAYLAWRYRRFPTAEHRMLAASRGGGDPVLGFAIYDVTRGKAFLRDLFAEDADATAGALLLALFDRLRRERVDSLALSCVGPPAFGYRLSRLGFFVRPLRRSLVLHPALVPAPLRERVLDVSSWFMLEGELDL